MPSLTITCDTKEKVLLFRSFLDRIIDTNLNVRIREEAMDHLFKIYHSDPENRKRISNIICLNDLEIKKQIERNITKRLRLEGNKRIAGLAKNFKKRMADKEDYHQRQIQYIQRHVQKLNEKVNKIGDI